MRKILFPLMIFLVSLIFFRSFIISGKLPLPSDTIVGLYHPFRDFFGTEYPRGIPYKNSLITDPVRQQYPWRFLVIEAEKKLQLPLWNPYAMAGYPLAGNYQSAPFYPLNLLFFILPFRYSWSILVLLQPVLAGIFLYYYLDHLRLHKYASFLGGIVFAFCGFSVAWMEWNTIVQTILWLPLILLAKEKLIKKISFIWILVFILAEISEILAGHVQTLFYALIVSNVYLLARLLQSAREEKKHSLLYIFSKYKLFLFIGVLVLFITSIQWFPMLQLISYSARDIDVDWHKAGWFIPWQHLVQFIAPDFFGNPSTLNYWGEWNYGELVGYIGVIPLIFALYAILFRRDKKTLFFSCLAAAGLLFATQNPISELPFRLGIPFLSTAQPTRLLSIIDFSLSILAAFGMDYFIRHQKKIIRTVLLVCIVFMILWLFALFGNNLWHQISMDNIATAKRNLIFPTIMFVVSTITIVLRLFVHNKKIIIMVYIIIVGIAVFDLFRFGDKFTPFTNQTYLFPSTKTIEFLQKNIGTYRYMTTDSRILPPNFSIMYKLQSVDGYDPLYLKSFGELIAASERNKPDISAPFGFNRIITPHNYDSKIIDLLGVKYILSLSDISSLKLKKVFQEGETQVYENKNVMPRAFFVDDVKYVQTKDEVIHFLYDPKIDLMKTAIIEQGKHEKRDVDAKGSVEMVRYSENEVVLKTHVSGDNFGFLVLTDTFYQNWMVSICCDAIPFYEDILSTDYNFRGVFVPKGDHTITFKNNLL